MRLTTLEMQRFGKFREHTVSLQAGLHLWQALNESGKSTTADFIRFIFYGFEKSRAKRPLLEDPLQKYQPWDAPDGMAGALEFVDDDGSTYRIERVLDAKGKGTVRVLDADGKEIDIPSPGEHFLGVDSDTFVNIFYIRQGASVPHRTAGMDVAMKNLVTTGSEEISFDSVMKFLQEERAKYSSPKRGMGKLKKLQEEMDELERTICFSEARLTEKRALLQQTQQTEAQISEMTDRLRALQKERDKIAAHDAYLREQKRAILQEQISGLEAQAAPMPQTADTEQLYEAFRQLDRARLCRERAEEELSALRTRVVTVDPRHETVLAHHQFLGNSTGKSLTILGALLLAAGAIGTLWSLWSLAGAVAGGVLLLVGIFKMRLPKALRELGLRNKMQLMLALQEAAAAKQAADSYEQALTEAEDTYRRNEAEEKNIKEKYLPLLQRAGVSSPEQLAEVQRRQAERRGQQAHLEQLRAQLRELSATAAEDARIAARQTQLMHPQQLEAEVRQAEEQKEVLLRRLAQNAALADNVRREEAEKSELTERLELCKEEYKRCAYCNEVALIAMEAMEQAQRALRDNYAPALRALVEKTLALLTDGKYDFVTLDEEFVMRIKADGGLRALDYFSQGTRDAAYLALRLSLAELVQGSRRIPLIFDDPFLSFDGNRRKNLEKQLQKLAQDRQILYFTCK